MKPFSSKILEMWRLTLTVHVRSWCTGLNVTQAANMYNLSPTSKLPMHWFCNCQLCCSQEPHKLQSGMVSSYPVGLQYASDYTRSKKYLAVVLHWTLCFLVLVILWVIYEAQYSFTHFILNILLPGYKSILNCTASK